MSQYDRLGEMLNEAIENGEIPKAENKNKKTTNESESNKEQEKLSKNNIVKSKKDDLYVQKYIHLYKIFNLNPDCSIEELRSSYHSLLKKYHPDNIPPFPEMQKTAARKTQELVEAYNLLINLIS